jgi:DNA-binding SARP family transcriptional activator
MRYRILGPIEVWRDGQPLAVGGPQQQALLALLLLNACHVVSTDRLIADIWGERPPASARDLLRGCVTRLRRALYADRAPASPQPLLKRGPGYLLEVHPGELDLHRFEELATAATAALADGSTVGLERAADLLHEALALWHGPALDGGPPGACRAQAARLEEQRLAALEQRIDIDLRLGRHDRLAGELQLHLRANPLRERLWAQLMLALYAADRPADALATYREVRGLLVEQLGIEPGSTLQRIEQAILVGGDPFEAYRSAHAARAAERGRTPQPPPEPGPPDQPPPEPGPRHQRSPEQHPPERAGPATPAQLPPGPSAFTGRAAHLKQLDTLLGREPTAVAIGLITGSAGVGKTGLAVHWAHRLRSRFDDGQLFVDLRGYAPGPPVRPIEALAGFLRALGVPAQQLPADPEQAAALYRSLMADRRVLVLLDNAADCDQVRPLLPAGPGCLVVVTSRDQLTGLVAHDGAHRLPLDVLAPAEAQALLVQLLGPERTAAEPGATADLAAACANLPLALRIAAANLDNHPDQRIADHVAELTSGDQLTALAVDGDDQSAVRVAFNRSYVRLPAAVRRLFRLSGLVPGPDLTADAAAALAGCTPKQAGRLLARLAAASLLAEPAPGRYGCHDLLRTYAAERVHADERGAATERLYDWYLHSADRAVTLLYPQMLRLHVPASDADVRPPDLTGHRHALEWLDAERPNLVAATVHAARHRPRRVAWLLADALRGYLMARMHTVDWLTVAEAGLAAGTAEADLCGQAAAELSLGDAHQRLSEYSTAAGHYQRALELSREAGWWEGQAGILGNIGNLHWLSAELPDAVDRYAEALALNRRTGRLAGQAMNLGSLGIAYRHLGRLPEAADHMTQAVALFRQIGSCNGEAIALGNLGEIHRDLGRFGDAVCNLTEALTRYRQTGDRGGEADTLRLLAATRSDAGESAPAVELAHAAMTLARDTGDLRVEANTLNTLSILDQRLGRPRQAADGHRRALALARETGNHYPEAVALIGLATAEQALQQPAAARAHAQQALATTRQIGYSVLEGQALLALAALDLADGDAGRAHDHAEQALALHQVTGHRLGEARAHALLADAVLTDAMPADTLPAETRTGAARTHRQRAAEVFADLGFTEAQIRDLLAES